MNAVLAKVRDLNPLDRRQALGELTLSGILKLESVLRNRLREADMTIDLRENELVRPYIIEAEKFGEQTGQRKTVTKQLKAEFGTHSVWARKRLEQASPKEMDRWQLRILTASALEKCVTRPSKPRGVDLR